MLPWSSVHSLDIESAFVIIKALNTTASNVNCFFTSRAEHVSWQLAVCLLQHLRTRSGCAWLHIGNFWQLTKAGIGNYTKYIIPCLHSDSFVTVGTSLIKKSYSKIASPVLCRCSEAKKKKNSHVSLCRWYICCAYFFFFYLFYCTAILNFWMQCLSLGPLRILF